jgi:hypothetical protein
MVMQLYCNGDSFVAGVELADEILPGYPGLLTWPPYTKQHEQHKIWLQSAHATGLVNRDKMKEIEKLELERAFPNKVSALTGIRVINRAMPGSSMDCIVRNSLVELYNLKKENPNENIIALVGTTYPGRREVSNDTPNRTDRYLRSQDWVCVSGTYSNAGESEYLSNMRKYQVMYDTQYHQMINFYKNIVLLQDFCKLNDITLHWVASHDNILTDSWPMTGYEDRLDINMLMEYAKLEYIVDMKKIVETEFVGKQVVCPGGHFAESIHQRTAEKIVDILRL